MNVTVFNFSFKKVEKIIVVEPNKTNVTHKMPAFNLLSPTSSPPPAMFYSNPLPMCHLLECDKLLGGKRFLYK